MNIMVYLHSCSFYLYTHLLTSYKFVLQRAHCGDYLLFHTGAFFAS